jgi:hypothetical protein
MAAMTTSQTLSTAPEVDSFELGLPHDFYREIHKGIRYAMFHTTMQAGTVDVADTDQVEQLVDRCTDLIDILHLHHHHEDDFVQPLLASIAPDLSATVEAQHGSVDDGIEQLGLLGRRLSTASHLARSNAAHRLYLDLTRFTAVYLDHQLFEETVVMPTLCAAVPVTELEAVHMTLRQSIPLDVLVDTMGVMLPAMNVAERSDMLAGMSLAPAEVFSVIRSAAESILTPEQFSVVADRIGLS